MLSYKKWKLLNENLDFPLGVKTPASIAEGPMSMSYLKKKMPAHLGNDDIEAGEKPFGKKPFGKKPPMDITAPDMGEPDMGDEEEVDLDMDTGEEPEEGEEEEGEEEFDMEMPAPPMKKGGLTDRTKGVAAGAKMMHKGALKMKHYMKEVCDPGCKCVKCVKLAEQKKKKMGAAMKPMMQSKHMTKEETEFFNSLKRQTGGTKFAKDEIGAWVAVKEDALIPPSNPNKNLEVEKEPGPGEVGYAPTGKVGSFEEWSAKYKK